MPNRGDVTFKLAAANAKQRPDDLAGRFVILIFDDEPGMNSAQPAQPGAAHDAHQYGFSLIVLRVGGCDFVERGCGGHGQESCEEFVPSLAGCGFDAQVLIRGEPRHIAALAMKFELMCVGKGADEIFVRIRFRAAQLVVEMDD